MFYNLLMGFEESFSGVWRLADTMPDPLAFWVVSSDAPTHHHRTWFREVLHSEDDEPPLSNVHPTAGSVLRTCPSSWPQIAT